MKGDSEGSGGTGTAQEQEAIPVRAGRSCGRDEAYQRRQAAGPRCSRTDQEVSVPQKGTPIGHGCYKIRLAIASKDKGKSGGARVITHVPFKCYSLTRSAVLFRVRVVITVSLITALKSTRRTEKSGKGIYFIQLLTNMMLIWIIIICRWIYIIRKAPNIYSNPIFYIPFPSLFHESGRNMFGFTFQDVAREFPQKISGEEPCSSGQDTCIIEYLFG